MTTKNHIELLDELQLYNIEIEKQQGRKVWSRGNQFIDFVSTNYLGLDFSKEMHHKGLQYVESWGSLCGWSRMEISPEMYRKMEHKIAQHLGANEVILSQTITITNFSCIPYIAKKGVIFADWIVHTVVWEACRLARDHGAKIERFRHQDMNDLEQLLKKYPKNMEKLIAVDGVYSISTEVAPILDLQYLAEKYNAWIYIDDAHGYGILGNKPCEEFPVGRGGNGVVNFSGGKLNRVFYVSSFGKAFCSQVAFISLPFEYKQNLRANCTQYLFSAPVNPYTFGQVDAALEINEQTGDRTRNEIVKKVKLFTQQLASANIKYLNHFSQPVVYIPVGDIDHFLKAAKFLLQNGILPGFRGYPLVTKDQCGFRFAITAQHSEQDILTAANILKSCLTDRSRPAQKAVHS